MIFQKLIKKIRKKFQKGFTLVEIMVTIAIIGLLSALIFVGVQSALASGRDSRRQGELSQVKKSLQAYYLANGNKYPTTALAGISLEEDNDADGDFTQAMKGGGYLPKIPRDPKHNVEADYSYKYIATTTDYYTLCAKSESKGGYLCVTGGTGVALEDDAPMFGSWGGAVFACGDIFSYDGKDYNTIEIGTQCWFSQNLNVGTMINSCSGGYLGICSNAVPSQTENSQGSSCVSIKKFCYNDSESNCNTYGGLYQWDQAVCGSGVEPARGVCPEGWHIPSDAEAKTLEMAIGMDQAQADATDWRGTTEGDELKISGACQGRSPCGTSGFDALLTGYRNTGGPFYQLGSATYFWTSSQPGAGAWARNFWNNQARSYRANFGKTVSFPIRCLQD
ncbi:MAG: FISUMP domain-containing protein [Candidatus Paceibacterota bacterium]